MTHESGEGSFSDIEREGPVAAVKRKTTDDRRFALGQLARPATDDQQPATGAAHVATVAKHDWRKQRGTVSGSEGVWRDLLVGRCPARPVGGAMDDC